MSSGGLTNGISFQVGIPGTTNRSVFRMQDEQRAGALEVKASS